MFFDMFDQIFSKIFAPCLCKIDDKKIKFKTFMYVYPCLCAHLEDCKTFFVGSLGGSFVKILNEAVKL